MTCLYFGPSLIHQLTTSLLNATNSQTCSSRASAHRLVSPSQSQTSSWLLTAALLRCLLIQQLIWKWPLLDAWSQSVQSRRSRHRFQDRPNLVVLKLWLSYKTPYIASRMSWPTVSKTIGAIYFQHVRSLIPKACSSFLTRPSNSCNDWIKSKILVSMMLQMNLVPIKKVYQSKSLRDWQSWSKASRAQNTNKTPKLSS